MNHFLDLLDTIKYIKIEISIQPAKKDITPCVDLIINDENLFSGNLEFKLNFNKKVGILEPIKIFILSKNNNALVLNSLKIDNFEIVPNYLYYGNTTYIDSNGDDIGPSEFLGVSGEWKFEIPESFYNWKHQVTNNGWLLYP